MLDWPLVTGVAPIVLSALGAGALLVLLARRGRRWWSQSVPVVALGAAAGVGVAALEVSVLRLFPDRLPAVVWCALAVALAGVGLAVAQTRQAGWRRRTAVWLAAASVIAAAASQVNQSYGEFPTIRSALGLPLTNQVDLGRVSSSAAVVTAGPSGPPLTRVWRAPPGMPVVGVVSQVVIPATVSGFRARPGWVYLPPAYLTSPRARLPVLVLLGGQPGSARDWLDGGALAAMLNSFAAAHAGLAPVVVMPDMLGATLANPLCFDSRLGNAHTYLARDVPAWIRSTLQVDPYPASWAVAGFSGGGTCALQLAVNSAEVYPSFVDISGQSEPSVGDRTRTVAAAFGGDTAAFNTVNPLDVLARRRFPNTAGIIIVGRDDAVYRPQAQLIDRATRRAGMRIEYREFAGGHNWHVWAPGLQSALPWLGARLHLTTP